MTEVEGSKNHNLFESQGPLLIKQNETEGAD